MLIFYYFSGFSSEFVKSFKYGFPSNWLSLVSDHFNSQSRLVFVICFVRGLEDNCDTGDLSLCMRIYNKVKVATITIHEVTILEIKATIALPFQSSLLVMQWQQRNPQKSALQVQCFSFAYFFPFCPWCGYTELTSSITMQKILDMRQFCLKANYLMENVQRNQYPQVPIQKFTSTFSNKTKTVLQSWLKSYISALKVKMRNLFQTNLLKRRQDPPQKRLNIPKPLLLLLNPRLR